MLRQFAERMERVDEAEIDETLLSPVARDRLAYRLAAVLEEGAFAIRMHRRAGAGPATSKVIVRVGWSYDCGMLCGADGRTFVTAGYQELVSVTDIMK